MPLLTAADLTGTRRLIRLAARRDRYTFLAWWTGLGLFVTATTAMFDSSLAKYDDLAKYMSASNVWCAWRGDHVIVHINLRNRSAEHVTATVKPRYFIARGGEHGSGLTSADDYGFDSGEFRSLWIDAGEPKGVRAGSPIARCAPYLFLIESG